MSVVVPAFNSEAILGELVERLGTILPKLADRFEIILVNDGSGDRTWECIQQFAAGNAWVHGICLMRNYGQHNAVLCGIREAKYDIIVTMDDDLQHPPEEITNLLTRLAEGYDVVYGTPRREQHSLWRNVASRITKIALQNAMGAEVARQVSAFRLFRRSVQQGFRDYNGPFVSIDVLLTWATTRFSAIPVQHNPRPIGKSNYTLWKLMTHALNMMTGFSTLPLQLASMIGFIFTLFGVGILFYVVGRYLIQGTTVAGFPFLASVIAIFSGAQLLALGVIGEYLARMHFRMMQRPSYTVRSKTP